MSGEKHCWHDGNDHWFLIGILRVRTGTLYRAVARAWTPPVAGFA